jgi:hypothetical protein
VNIVLKLGVHEKGDNMLALYPQEWLYSVELVG